MGKVVVLCLHYDLVWVTDLSILCFLLTFDTMCLQHLCFYGKQRMLYNVQFEVRFHNQLQVDIINWSKHDVAATFPGVHNSFTLQFLHHSGQLILIQSTHVVLWWKSKLQEF